MTNSHFHDRGFQQVFLALAVAVLTCAASGCTSRQSLTGQPATSIDPATTQPIYWMNQPVVASARSNDFERLWNATQDVARDFYFRIDRTDYRSGLLTTRPVISKQWFEPWRRDVQDLGDLGESSLATVRRMARFEFERLQDGQFAVSPKVLVERQTLAEQRVTAAVGYRSIFTRPAQPHRRQRGTRESDVGIYLPERYWYPIGRDEALEKALVRAIQRRLAG